MSEEDQDNTQDSHTISLFVANKPGVLYRVTMVFARRGYNIESLVVSPALDGNFSRMTITAKGDINILEQIIKQCDKLVDVVHASEHLAKNVVEKELAMIKVKANQETRFEVLQLVEHFKTQTVDVSDESLIIMATGNTEKLDAMLKMLERYGILELVRTGKVLMARGKEKT